MSKHENFDKYFDPCTVIVAEGARIGISSCSICGAAVMADPRDEVNRFRMHIEWHHTWLIPALLEDEG